MELIQIGRPRRVGGQLRPLRGVDQAALIGVGIGAASLLGALLAPGTLPALLGGWGAFAATFGLLTLGGAAWWGLGYRGTEPGVRNDGAVTHGLTARGVAAWATALGLTAFYVLLYWHPEPLGGAVQLADPVSLLLTGKPADRWFLYGLLYSLSVLVFGVRMAMRYRHRRYQLLRTGSVVFFQLAFGFLLPSLLKGIGQPDFYFTYFWPLKPDYLLPFDYVIGDGGIAAARWGGVATGRAMLLWGAAMTFVATPLLTWRFGKRWYCSWVCGCGGLAETLGDPWRQLSDRSVTAWRIERWSIHLVLVAIVGITGFGWLNEALGRPWLSDGGSGLFWKTYGLVIVMAFSGVVGVGFYPLLGARVWCRFGCPMAAILGIIQRFASRFRITTNGGQCISCGNCSAFCEMGIDVRSYAQRGVNVVRASCVGCGICAEVCPRGVLRLETGPVGDRFPGADRPLRALRDALRGKP